jgi:hypothetical protein
MADVPDLLSLKGFFIIISLALLVKFPVVFISGLFIVFFGIIVSKVLS